ncbi:uncharacterized protein LOC127861201 [Dreissena polymorpha]|nr:uncharacterized protein LOC127861201 [Dreissena polymorpha]
MLYARNVALDVEPAFYDVRGQKFPLVVDTRLKYVKRASSCFEKTLFHATSGTLFAKLTGIDVNVDYVTRKPTPYPDWFRRKIISDIDAAKVEYTIPTKPQVGVFTSHHIIRLSDTDENRHTNYCTYSRVCLDSLCENITAGNYGSGLDAYNLALRTMEVTFKKESKLGDVITVTSWQDAHNRDTFYFEISNLTGDVITTSMMRFYGSKHYAQSKM